MTVAKKSDLFAEGSSVRILTFDLRLGNGAVVTLGMNIQKIKEILDPLEIQVQKLTENYRPLIGLLNLRHISVPLLDLTEFLGNKDQSTELFSKGKRIIVCEFQRLHLGILVSGIHKIRQVSNSTIQPVAGVLSTFPGNIFNGVLEDQGKFINLLDIEYILTKLNVDVAPQTESKSTDQSLRSKTVLVVEDSRLFQKKLMSFFQSRGCHVILAEDGEQGLEQLKHHAHEIDLVFSDIEMPKLNGIGMVRKMKQNKDWSHLPVIFNTSISNPGLIEDISSEGLGHYIVKFDENEINNAVQMIFKDTR